MRLSRPEPPDRRALGAVEAWRLATLKMRRCWRPLHFSFQVLGVSFAWSFRPFHPHFVVPLPLQDELIPFNFLVPLNIGCQF